MREGSAAQNTQHTHHALAVVEEIERSLRRLRELAAERRGDGAWRKWRACDGRRLQEWLRRQAKAAARKEQRSELARGEGDSHD